MKITGSLSLIFFQRRGIGWFFESATFKKPEPAVLQKLKELSNNGLYSQSDFYFCGKFWQSAGNCFWRKFWTNLFCSAIFTNFLGFCNILQVFTPTELKKTPMLQIIWMPCFIMINITYFEGFEHNNYTALLYFTDEYVTIIAPDFC